MEHTAPYHAGGEFKHFLFLRSSSSGSDFNSAQRVKKRKEKKKDALALLYPSLQCQTLPFLIFPFDSQLGSSFTQLGEVGAQL